MSFWICLFLFLSTFIGQASDEIVKVSLPLIPGIERADIYALKVTLQPVGVLVLCPGYNGNGKDWIKEAVWKKFASAHNLDLIGLSFASETSLLAKGRGYYYPRQGSGQLLLDGIQHIYHHTLPLIMYGFSGGAHFTSGFAEWKPNLVIAWCAYSAEWWEEPKLNRVCPPGLIACGEDDERYGASLIYFKQGRALGKPWLWMCAPKTGHSIYGPAEEFIRDYFVAILDEKGERGADQWVDIDLKTRADEEVVNNQPTLTGWLPNKRLLTEWQAIHQP